MGKASREKRERKAAQNDDAQAPVARVAPSSTQPVRSRQPLPERGPAADRSGVELAESLAELLRPYMVAGMGAEAERMLASVAVLAWNMSITHGRVPRQKLEKQVSNVHPTVRRVVTETLEEMVQRKLQLFPKDRRRIAGAELHDKNNGTFALTVTLVDD